MLIHSRHGAKAALLASAVLFGLSGPAGAQTRTDAQAQDLSKQLQEWMVSILGPKVPLPPNVVKVSPDGERFRINLPLPPGLVSMQDTAGKPTDALFSAAVRPIGGTRWRVEAFDMPALAQLSPESAAALGALSGGMPNNTPGNKPSGTAGGPAAAPKAEFRIRSQSASGMFDTSLATESRLEWRMEGITYTAENLGGQADGRTTTDIYTGTTRLSPARGGGIDIASEGVIEGYSQVSTNATMGPMRIMAKRMQVRGELGALMTNQITNIIQTIVGLGMDAQAGGSDPKRQEAAKKDGLRKVIALMKGIMGGLSVEETVEGLEVEMMGQRGGAGRLAVAFGSAAPTDKFKAFLEIGLDGLKVSGLPPQFADLMPRSIVLRPTIGNIDVKALTALAEEAAADNADAPAVERKFMALITTGGTELGMERLSIDLGFARLQASGTATMISQDWFKGQGEIAVTGFDALMDRAQKMPEAAQAVPALALLKGLGKTEGDRLVWRLSLTDDKKVLVNGMDLAKLGGGK